MFRCIIEKPCLHKRHLHKKQGFACLKVYSGAQRRYISMSNFIRNTPIRPDTHFQNSPSPVVFVFGAFDMQKQTQT